MNAEHKIVAGMVGLTALLFGVAGYAGYRAGERQPIHIDTSPKFKTYPLNYDYTPQDMRKLVVYEYYVGDVNGRLEISR